jgi:hypothetical protein
MSTPVDSDSKSQKSEAETQMLGVEDENTNIAGGQNSVSQFSVDMFTQP